MSEESQCNVCGETTTRKCSACGQVFYCSKDHQKTDWKNHKNNCSPCKMLVDPVVGRYLVATRDIKPGELIMKKPPLLLAPKRFNRTVLCLGCHKKLLPGKKHFCSKCTWPLCSETCENSTWHKMECELLTPKFKLPNKEDPGQFLYTCILLLRSLYYKKHHPQKFELLHDFQSHLDQHMNENLYKILRRELSRLFLGFLELDTNEEEIMRLCSIFDTNCFEVRNGSGMVAIRGLYPYASLMMHNCTPNTQHYYEGDNLEMCLTATVEIKKNEPITTTYVQTLWGTAARRDHLKKAKLFDCICKRCADPTEFGVFAGSIYCNVCDDSAMMICEDPLNWDAQWKCQKCDYYITADDMKNYDEAVTNEIKMLEKSGPEALEEFLESHNLLHPRNWHCLEVKYALCQMYGYFDGYLLEEMTPELLQRKIDLCRELLEVADLIVPGLTRFRGYLLYDLQATMERKARVDFEQNKITKEEAEETLHQVVGYLKQYAEILKTEPELKQEVATRLENIPKILLI